MNSNDMLASLSTLDMPVFTTSDVAGLTGKPASYVKVLLSLLARKGKIEKIERGKYCLIGTSPYTIASRLVRDSYVALISAARFHNITTQMPREILVFTGRSHRETKIKGNYTLRFLRVNRKILYGFGEYNRAYVSEIEKIFVDDVYYHRSLLYTEEFESAVKRRLLDFGKLRKYAAMTGNKRVERSISAAIGLYAGKNAR